MTFDPTTNSIPFGLLTPEEQDTLKAWPQGWKFYTPTDYWIYIENPSWQNNMVYRGKPAAVIHQTYISVYEEGITGLPWHNLVDARRNSEGKQIATLHIETVNDKVSVTVLD